MTPLDDPMLVYAQHCVGVLHYAPAKGWGALWVQLRMDFARSWQQGPDSITSTSHGIEFFENVVACCEGRMTWEEKGEYGNNFRKLITNRPINRST